MGVDATAEDILSVTNGNIVGDNPGADRIVFWDSSAGKLTHLTAGTGLSISGTTMTVDANVGKTYTLTADQTGGNNNNPNINLSDGTTDDPIQIVGGNNVSVVRNSNSQITINATADSNGGAVPSGIIVMWSGSLSSIPTGWVLCNGGNGTPDLRNRFVVGAYNDSQDLTFPNVRYGEIRGNDAANAVVVAHDHGITDPGHFHNHNDEGVELSEARYGAEGERLVNGGEENERNTGSKQTGISINNRGKNTSGSNSNSQTHVNMNLPPSFALFYIMKT